MIVAIVMCSSSKVRKECSAQHMYSSERFKANLIIAKQKSDVCYILSGKYGLLNLDEIIKYYDTDLNHASDAQLIYLVEELKKQMNLSFETSSIEKVITDASGKYLEVIACAMKQLNFLEKLDSRKCTFH